MTEGAKASVLVVDDEENMRHMLASLLRRAGYAVETAADGRQALDLLPTITCDVILCDIKMPEMDGMDFLRAGRDRLGGMSVIMMSAYGTIDLAVESMKLGAYDFISKPFKSDEVLLSIEKALERDRLKRENSQLREEIKRIGEHSAFGSLVARSQAMKAVFLLGNKVAQYNTTVLIVGESGTGKELAARAIHYASPRKEGPWVPVNCGGIPENLLESELFGYVKGAFTGADRTRKGLFEEAADGTIFLDEIGELPLPMQVKLLRVLQENEIRPVGQAQAIRMDVRVIAATSRNLEEMVAAGGFREDLYYRLNVLPIRIPPLRERSEDIPLLCRHFVERFNETLGRRVRGISPEAMSGLLASKWPGNVRELENAIERAFVLSEGDILEPEHFNAKAMDLQGGESQGNASGGYSLKAAQKVLEKEMIIKALMATGGNRTHAARLLEISHPSLLSKLKVYGIEL